MGEHRSARPTKGWSQPVAESRVNGMQPISGALPGVVLSDCIVQKKQTSTRKGRSRYVEEICIVTVNCSRRCGSSDGIEGLVVAITECFPSWSFILCQELDCYGDNHNPTLSGFTVWRHYPGEGSFAIAIIARDTWFLIMFFTADVRSYWVSMSTLRLHGR